jgi:hypothetical protein
MMVKAADRQQKIQGLAKDMDVIGAHAKAFGADAAVLRHHADLPKALGWARQDTAGVCAAGETGAAEARQVSGASRGHDIGVDDASSPRHAHHVRRHADRLGREIRMTTASCSRPTCFAPWARAAIR